LGSLDSKDFLSHPLTCPKCQGAMRIISIIEDQEVVNKIFGHLRLRQTHQRPPPKSKTLELQIDYSDSQLPFCEDQDFRNSSLCLLTFVLVFLLDRAFFVLYILSVNKEILIKYR
jgi:hypothetical protein